MVMKMVTAVERPAAIAIVESAAKELIPSGDEGNRNIEISSIFLTIHAMYLANPQFVKLLCFFGA